MYQINYLPWRHRLFRQKAWLWLSQTLSLLTITFVICSITPFDKANTHNSTTTIKHSKRIYSSKQLEYISRTEKKQTLYVIKTIHSIIKTGRDIYITFNSFEAIECIFLQQVGLAIMMEQIINSHCISLPNTQSLLLYYQS